MVSKLAQSLINSETQYHSPPARRPRIRETSLHCFQRKEWKIRRRKGRVLKRLLLPRSVWCIRKSSGSVNTAQRNNITAFIKSPLLKVVKKKHSHTDNVNSISEEFDLFFTKYSNKLYPTAQVRKKQTNWVSLTSCTFHWSNKKPIFLKILAN